MPLNTSFAVFSPSTEMLFLTRWGAPTRPIGGLRVVIFTEWMVPSAAAATASRPSSAPVGTMMRPPLALARSIRSGRGSSAPQDSTITCLPASSIGRQMRSISEAGAHSIARSACSGNSSSSTTGQSIFCSFSQSRALSALPVAMQARRQAGKAVGEAARHGAADRAEAGDGNTGRVHGVSLCERARRLRAMTAAQGCLTLRGFYRMCPANPTDKPKGDAQ